MKAASKESFSLDKKYEQPHGLLLAYVWHVDDGKETEVFFLTYADAEGVLRLRGHDQTKSWREDGKYSITNPGLELRGALAPFKVATGGFRERLATHVDRRSRNALRSTLSAGE